jgi:hypothetical protein
VEELRTEGGKKGIGENGLRPICYFAFLTRQEGKTASVTKELPEITEVLPFAPKAVSFLLKW